MNLVIDANILFAVLIKESTTYELLFSNKLRLYAPEYILEEFSKYQEEILKKTKRTEKDFEELLNILKRRIKIISLNELTKHISKAQQISPDPKDIAYFALALKLKLGIWSNDKALKNQDIVNVYNTQEIIEDFSTCEFQ